MSAPYIPEMFWNDRVGALGDLGDGYGNRNLQDYEDHLRTKKTLEILGDVSNLSVLDVGCGTGRWSVRLAKMGGIVTGIDISSRMIERARARAARNEIHNITFLNQGAEGLAYSNSFDLALAATTLQHIIDDQHLERAVQGIVNAVKPEGRILIIESASSSGTRRDITEVGVPFMSVRPRQEWIDVFRNCGAEIITSREVWLLVPRVPMVYNRFGNRFFGGRLERLAQAIDGRLAEYPYLRQYAKPTIFLFGKRQGTDNRPRRGPSTIDRRRALF